jgi:hypothetical protein
VQASLIPHVNPITFAINLIKSIPVGIDHVLAELGVGRALGITPSGPYGVGGPQLPAPPGQGCAIRRTGGSRGGGGHSQGNDAKTVSAQTDTTSTSVPEPKVRPTAARTKPKPPAKQPDRPKVRGPIEFDLQKTPTESPSSASKEPSATSETSATEDSV